MPYRDEMRKIASEYFTDILYIDDALKPPGNYPFPGASDETAASAVENSETISRPVGPPKRILEVVPDLPAIIPNDLEKFSGAYGLVMDFQRKGCKASPFYFSSASDLTSAIELIEQSHLTILDWNLDSTNGDTTVQILRNVLVNKKRMKILVIYTLNPVEATRILSETFHYEMNLERKTDQKEYYYTFTEGALILVCSRNFNAGDILDSVIQHILKKFGLFPLAFLQSINQINKETAAILLKFSQPFENALILQLQSSDLEVNDFSPVVGQMISNHINKVIAINGNIFCAVIEEWKTAFNDWLAKPETEFMSRIINCLDDMIAIQNTGTNGKANKRKIALLKSIEYQKWQEIFVLVIQSCTDNKKIASKEVINKIIQEAKEVQANIDWSSCPELDKLENKTVIKEKYLKILKGDSYGDIKEILGPLVPSILVHMIMKYQERGELSASLVELINVMKLLPYENQTLSDIAGKENLNNILYNGDILFQISEDTKEEFLFCISPSCDVFRPSKVSNLIKFVVGKRIESDSTILKLKDSEQMTILPDPTDCTKLICVKWEFFNTRVIPITELKDYSRPYRLDSTYAQQITNNYIAYHSRTGVEELFFKHERSIRNYFVFRQP